MARAKMHVDITANNHVESPRPLSAISDTSTVLEHGPVLMEKFKEFLERYESETIHFLNKLFKVQYLFYLIFS